MGYTTEFEGILSFKESLTAEQELYLLTLTSNQDFRQVSEIPHAVLPKIGYNGYIQLEIDKDKAGIQWDGSEKFYDAVDAVNTIILTMRAKFPEFGLTGSLRAQGEDIGDIWDLVIVDGLAVEKQLPKPEDLIKCPHCQEQFRLNEVK